MTLIGEDVMSGKNDDHISPYLRRPIRSLMEYLREAALRRKQEQERRGQADESDSTQCTTEDDRRGKDE